jgi:transposase
MTAIDYIGFDIHKKTISFCAKAQDGRILDEGIIPARRADLSAWAKKRVGPWRGAMEATLFTGWIYDYLKPYAQELKVAHPAMLKAIAASKKKNDKVDARKISDLLRCDLLPECYMAPSRTRELRRVLRYRNLVVRQATRMKNRIAGLLMETGTVYNKQRLHGKAYFSELLGTLQDVPRSVVDLLKLSRGQLEFFATIQRRLLQGLRTDPELQQRVERLQSIRGVGEIVALTWVLEIADVTRFPSIGQALSYCGLTSAQRNSAGKEQRGPISKQRNPHLQTILIEAANLAPRHNPQLAVVYDRERKAGANCNQATLEVARKLVAYLMAVDKSGKPFEVRARGAEEVAGENLSRVAGSTKRPTTRPNCRAGKSNASLGGEPRAKRG